MPIGDFEQCRQVHMGLGDIEVIHGTLDVEEVVGSVCFVERQTVNTIGWETEYKENTKFDANTTPVRLIFEKIESIDVVISALVDAKKMMLEKRKALEVSE